MLIMVKKIWYVFLIACALLLFPPATCHAGQSAKPVPPILSVNGGDDYGSLHVDTQAPQYMIEWDTTKSFQHKKVYALYRDTAYQAALYPGTTKEVHFYFPDPTRTYYVRAYNIYPQTSRQPQVSRASAVLKISPQATPVTKAPNIKKCSRPRVKASFNKENACIDLELTLPARATGYMVECSRLKSFPFTKLHPLYWDSENYYIRYHNAVKDRKQLLQIATSELAGNHTYIRVYAVCDQPEQNRSYISSPTAVKKVSWR